MRGCASRLRLLAAILASSVLAPATTAVAARVGPTGPRANVLAAVVLADERPETRERAMAAVRAANASVAHVFDGLLVVEGRPEALRKALRSPSIKEIGTEVLSAYRHRRRPEGFHAGLYAWNRFFKDQGRRFSEFSQEEEPKPAPEGPDAWFPPAAALAAGENGLPASRLDGTLGSGGGEMVCAASSFLQPYGATSQNTTEFLAGAVSVNLFLVQSDGTKDVSTEKWTADREQTVVAQVAAGLDWLRDQEPAAKLSFVYHVIPGRLDARARTGYEPIVRKADPMGTTGEDLWVGQILTNMGYTSGDRFTRARALANDTRRADGTDWGVSVFVADSLNDADGQFADGYFAYAWIGGPHLVMTYDVKSWRVDRMNQVMRHEVLHSFFAFDEYTGSGCGCTEHRGYLDGTNANCRSCNADAVYCVMDSNGAAMCDGTRRQIGWSDLDGDGADDVIGEDPDTVLDALPASVCGPVVLTGQGAVVAATNRNPSGITPKVSISVNRIARVEWRADGGAWLPAEPSDGAWGDYVEACKATAPLSAGAHTLEIRAVDDHGNADATAAAAAVGVLPGATDPGNAVAVARSGGGAASLSWTGAPAAALYRVYRSAGPSGPFSKVAETAATAWTDSTTGSRYYVIRAVDACGGESAP